MPVSVSKSPQKPVPRADYIDIPYGLAHVPDLYVPDHDRLPVGFLHDRFRSEPRPKRLPDVAGRWPALRKHVRAR